MVIQFLTSLSFSLSLSLCVSLSLTLFLTLLFESIASHLWTVCPFFPYLPESYSLGVLSTLITGVCLKKTLKIGYIVRNKLDCKFAKFGLRKIKSRKIYSIWNLSFRKDAGNGYLSTLFCDKGGSSWPPAPLCFNLTAFAIKLCKMRSMTPRCAALNYKPSCREYHEVIPWYIYILATIL